MVLQLPKMMIKRQETPSPCYGSWNSVQDIWIYEMWVFSVILECQEGHYKNYSNSHHWLGKLVSLLWMKSFWKFIDDCDTWAWIWCILVVLRFGKGVLNTLLKTKQQNKTTHGHGCVSIKPEGNRWPSYFVNPWSTWFLREI